MKLMPVLALIFTLALNGCTQVQQAKGQNVLQNRIQTIATTFLAGNISRIEILRIPSRILTRSAITPEMIEKSFFYKGAHKDKLLKALDSLSVQPAAEMKDIRWGVLFYAKDGTRIGALYFDKNGGYGAVDGISASFKGDFFKWLDGGFSDCFL
jgi:hypothetical protein